MMTISRGGVDFGMCTRAPISATGCSRGAPLIMEVKRTRTGSLAPDRRAISRQALTPPMRGMTRSQRTASGDSSA